MNNLKKVIAYNIRKYRQLKKLTQEKFSELCEKSLSFIGDVENERTAPSIKTLSIMAKVLEIETYQLLIPEHSYKKDYYLNFYSTLKGKIDADLFKAIEDHIKDHGL